MVSLFDTKSAFALIDNEQKELETRLEHCESPEELEQISNEILKLMDINEANIERSLDAINRWLWIHQNLLTSAKQYRHQAQDIAQALRNRASLQENAANRLMQSLLVFVEQNGNRFPVGKEIILKHFRIKPSYKQDVYFDEPYPAPEVEDHHCLKPSQRRWSKAAVKRALKLGIIVKGAKLINVFGLNQKLGSTHQTDFSDD